MCDIGIALTVASTLVGAAGAIQQGQATAAAANYNAQIQEMNAKIADRRAQDAIERGAADEQRKRQEVAGIEGQQRAALAANGVDLSFGSPLDSIVDTAVLGELDALTVRSNAYREAYDDKVSAADSRAQANLSRLKADSAETGGYLGAMNTVLTGAGKVYKGAYTSGGIGAIS